MHPPSSSTSSSEAAPAASRWRTAGLTAAGFAVTLLLFELLCWIAFNHTPLRNASMRSYFWYGSSYESKLRQLVATPNPAPNSILFAGWINEQALADKPADVDVTVYGSSFAGNLGKAMRELRPELKLRFIGGPGAPLNHAYGFYELDRSKRKTRTAVIGVASEDVAQVLTMNIGSVNADAPMPYFFPRYELVGGRIERTGTPLINSPDELARAFRDDPALWARQLDVMAQHDDAFQRPLFAASALDHSLIARFVRRGLAKRHADNYVAQAYGSRGFKKDSHIIQVFEAVLLRMVEDLRAEGVKPVVVLFSTRDYANHLDVLMRRTLEANGVPVVSSFDLCPSTDRTHYIPDGHFTPQCDLKTAQATLAVLDQDGGTTR